MYSPSLFKPSTPPHSVALQLRDLGLPNHSRFTSSRPHQCKTTLISHLHHVLSWLHNFAYILSPPPEMTISTLWLNSYLFHKLQFHFNFLQSPSPIPYIAHYVFSALYESSMFPRLISLLAWELSKNISSVLLTVISLVPITESVLNECLWTPWSSLPVF